MCTQIAVDIHMRKYIDEATQCAALEFRMNNPLNTNCKSKSFIVPQDKNLHNASSIHLQNQKSFSSKNNSSGRR